MNYNSEMKMEDFSREIEEHYSETKQTERMKSYLAIVKANIVGNNLAGKKKLEMKGVWGYIDIQGDIAVNYLTKLTLDLGKELGLELRQKHSEEGITYTW